MTFVQKAEVTGKPQPAPQLGSCVLSFQVASGLRFRNRLLAARASLKWSPRLAFAFFTNGFLHSIQVIGLGVSHRGDVAGALSALHQVYSPASNTAVDRS